MENGIQYFKSASLENSGRMVNVPTTYQIKFTSLFLALLIWQHPFPFPLAPPRSTLTGRSSSFLHISKSCLLSNTQPWFRLFSEVFRLGQWSFPLAALWDPLAFPVVWSAAWASPHNLQVVLKCCQGWGPLW